MMSLMRIIRIQNSTIVLRIFIRTDGGGTNLTIDTDCPKGIAEQEGGDFEIATWTAQLPNPYSLTIPENLNLFTAQTLATRESMG